MFILESRLDLLLAALGIRFIISPNCAHWPAPALMAKLILPVFTRVQLPPCLPTARGLAILSMHDHSDGYIPALRGTRTVSEIRQAGYKSAFILHRSTSFKLAALTAGIPYRVGLYGQWLDQFILTESLPADAGGDRRALWGHRPFIAAADEWIAAQNLVLDDKTPTILPAPDMVAIVANFLAHLPRPITIVNLFAADPARRWSLDHASATLKNLAHQLGGSLLLNAGPDAASYHDAMLEQWDGPADQLIDSLRYAPSLARDIAFYHAADGYVGVDSFTANLAFNCNLPATVLFAKAGDRLRYKPAVFPLFPDAGKGLDSISPDDIIDQCAKMLQASR